MYSVCYCRSLCHEAYTLNKLWFDNNDRSSWITFSIHYNQFAFGSSLWTGCMQCTHIRQFVNFWIFNHREVTQQTPYHQTITQLQSYTFLRRNISQNERCQYHFSRTYVLLANKLKLKLKLWRENLAKNTSNDSVE